MSGLLRIVLSQMTQNRFLDGFFGAKALFMSRQFLMFVLVGGSSTLLQLVLLVVFIEWLVVGKVLASAAGYLLSAVYNYFLNYHLTFASAQSHRQALPKFIAVVCIGVIVNTLAFAIMLNITPYVVAQLVAVGATLVVNFLLHKFWIYRRAQ